MAKVISKQQLIGASIDADDLGIIMNAPPTYQDPDTTLPPGYMRTRLGMSVRVASKALQDIVLSGTIDNAAVNTLTAYVVGAMQHLNNIMVALGIDTSQDIIDQDTGEKYAYAISDSGGQAAFIVDLTGNVLFGNARTRVDTVSGEFAYVITGADNYVAFGIMADGAIMINNIIVGAASDEDSGGYVFAIRDVDGYVAFAIKKDGTVVLGGLESDSPTGDLKHLQVQKTSYMHIVSYGQSLSRGSRGLPVRSTTQPYNNVTFQSGVLVRPNDEIAGYPFDGSSFKPLVEAQTGTDVTGGETPTSSTANRLCDYITAKNGSIGDYVFFGNAPGQGGYTLEQLSKGTTMWGNLIDSVSIAMKTANGNGGSFSVWAMLWAQGEDDYNVGTSALNYRNALITLKNDFANAVAPITRQDFVPIMATYQTACHRTYGQDNNQIAIAQWRASVEDQDIILACPMYAMTYTDTVHLTNDGYVQFGKYYARALYQTIFEGQRWKPVQPERVVWQGRVIDITFNVPHGELAWDTALVSAAPNYGFDIWAGDGSGNYADDDTAIASVTLKGADRVLISLSRDPLPTDLLTYGRGRIADPRAIGPTAGPRGNLRDSAGDDDYYVDAAGVTRYMHNWCVMFEWRYNQ